MSKCILVYKLDIFIEDGGGVYAEDFTGDLDEEKLHKRVNELSKIHKNAFSIIYAGCLQFEFEYTPLTYITEYVPKQK